MHMLGHRRQQIGMPQGQHNELMLLAPGFALNVSVERLVKPPGETRRH